ncbi:MAG: response regulator transcription factor [Bryobacterales bacterium]|nr:response regulator transcription factor [Bryobacterales bacterium]
MNAPSETLLLVDDDTELCSLMREFFAEMNIALEVAHDGEQGLAKAISGRYAMVILDVMMPRLDGFGVLMGLRRQSNVPVLMLTARAGQQSRIQGLNEGADDYLAKPFDPYELLARVRAILRRSQPPSASQEPIEVMGVRMDPRARTVTRGGQPIDVTAAEFDVLELLLRSAGRVVTRDELANRLYQRDSTPFDRAIDVHVSHLRKKLDIPRNWLRTIRGSGYQFCLEENAEAEP